MQHVGVLVEVAKFSGIEWNYLLCTNCDLDTE